MAEEVEIDQKVYDDLIAQGKSERIARAKAKAAAVKAKKVAAGEKVGPREAQPAAATGTAGAGAAKAAAAAPGAAGARTAGGGGVGTQERPGGVGMTPEERQKRVAAALAGRGGDGNGRGNGASTALAGQDHTHRLLAMVPPDGIQQIRGKQDDKVYTWPHLLGAEFICLLAVTAALVVFSALAPAPLRELANSNQTPNPSKAPWYFLGLQELLRYFHPMVAGVLMPGLGLLAFAMLPYVDRNPSIKPENRKTAYVLFTFFLLGSSVLTIVGSFFRGPGFEFVWPWIDGLFFEL